jgi:uncharacterized membrane protein YtjA (UPF0391 family)
MLALATVFLIVTLLTAILGFGGIVGPAAAATYLVFVAALVGFAITAMAGLVRIRD